MTKCLLDPSGKFPNPTTLSIFQQTPGGSKSHTCALCHLTTQRGSYRSFVQAFVSKSLWSVSPRNSARHPGKKPARGLRGWEWTVVTAGTYHHNSPRAFSRVDTSSLSTLPLAYSLLSVCKPASGAELRVGQWKWMLWHAAFIAHRRLNISPPIKSSRIKRSPLLLKVWIGLVGLFCV